MGRQTGSIVNRVTITFFGGRTTALPMGPDTSGSNMGSKGLGVWPRSVLHMHGKRGNARVALCALVDGHRGRALTCLPRVGLVGPRTWTRVAATAPAGSMSVTLQEEVRDDFAGWNNGDSIVIASTDFQASGTHPDQSEVGEVHLLLSDAMFFCWVLQEPVLLHTMTGCWSQWTDAYMFALCAGPHHLCNFAGQADDLAVAAADVHTCA